VKDSGRRDTDASLAIRAAWLHYVGGLTQAEVAKRLGIASVKAHRLIMRASQEGSVKVVIDGEIAECVALEHALSQRFGLSYAEVVPELHDDPMPIRALGIAGSQYLAREIEGGETRLIGVGHGRTLAAAIGMMVRVQARGVRFVSLLGGLTRNMTANPHDTIHRLAEKTGADAYVMPVPFFANSLNDREVMLAQRGVRDVFDLAAKSDLKFVGIGTAEAEASLVATGMVAAQEVSLIKARGGVGEMLGHFFDAQGRPLETLLTARTLSLGLDDLKNSRIVAVAGGKIKTGAIRSVLLSGLLTGLITDERTAFALLNDTPH